MTPTPEEIEQGLRALKQSAREQLERARKAFANPTTPDDEKSLAMIESCIERASTGEDNKP